MKTTNVLQHHKQKKVEQRLGLTQNALFSTSGTTRFFEDESIAKVGEVDLNLSILLTLYAFMKTHPERFHQTGPKEELTWNYHHENWMRAYQLLACTKSRRTSLKNYPFKGGKKPNSPTSAEAQLVGYTLTVLQKEADEAGRDQRNEVAISSLRNEMAMMFPDIV